MTLLTKNQIIAANIISNGEDPTKNEKKSWRATSHDSRVGTIITKKGLYDKDTYFLKPRAIVWLVSEETYTLPADITGVTTLKTGLTKNGLLTVTAGIVDPSYSGPISTVIINFSQKEFPIKLGDTFFRTMFFKHEETSERSVTVSHDDYIATVIKKTTSFSDTFLTLNTLAVELSREIFKMPRITVGVTLAGIALATLFTVFAIAAPPAWSVMQGIGNRNAEILEMQSEISSVQAQLTLRDRWREEAAKRRTNLEQRISELERAIAATNQESVQ